MPAGYHMRFVRTVTRYGGHKHLARDEGNPFARHFTVCAGTSSWTIQSWERRPDHPLLTIEQIKLLSHCPHCTRSIYPAGEAPPVTYTADFVMLERQGMDFLCGASVEAPCSVKDCPRPHTMSCSRPLGHDLDVHIAIGIDEMVAVWLAIPVNEGVDDGGDRDPA